MTAPIEPHDIARRTFDVARRGYEQQEVRGFLHEVSAVVERLSRAEQEQRERADRAESKLGANHQPDESVLLEVLGEETTRVLTSARDAANEIRTKAEEAASRIIAEATAEAAEVRGGAVRDADALLAETKQEREATLQAARAELERRSAEAEEVVARIRADGEAAAQALRAEGEAALAKARTDAEAALEVARQEGRLMVVEAQAVRERVLRDLAVRRKRARQQVEKLNAGRERLLQAYDVVRRTVGEATDELTTSLSDARLAADGAARRIEEEPEPTLEQLDEEVANAGLIDLPLAELDSDRHAADQDADHGHHDHDREHDGPGPFSGEVPAVDVAGGAVPAPEAAAAELPGPRRPVEPDERRSRKRRRKGGFEGLPPGELTVLQPPSEDEGVRVLAQPTEPTEPASDEPAPGADALAEPSAEPVAQPPAASVVPGGPTDGTAPAAEVDAPREASTSDAAVPDAATVTDGPASEAATEESPATQEPTAAASAPGDASGSTADDVFARLRADQIAGDAAAESAADTDGVAGPGAAGDDEADTDVEDDEDATPGPVDAAMRPFLARRAALTSVEKELTRRLKRGLSDEQNEVLDLLRRAKPKGVDDLLPGVDEHAARWADTVTKSLLDAAAAGADWSGGTSSSVADLADELSRGLTAPLRERIERSFAASDGNLDDVADRVRALYREWKGQRLTETSAHFVAAAYARGVFDGVDTGTLVQWVVDPDAGPCPDCDDNVLAGPIAKGAEFPTGNLCAPAHPGCHCLVLAVEG